jgi:hypothetical protein
MTGEPIDLDGRRPAAGLLEAEMRRRSANGSSPPGDEQQPSLGDVESELLAEPARTWIAVMEKWRFLLDRYSATPDADDERIQKLIRRAIGDLERMKKREERKR